MYQLLVGMALAITAVLGGGAAQARPSQQDVPASLAVPSGQVMLLEAAARGAQVYGCQAKADDPRAFEWALKGPDAVLMNSRGEQIGRHYAGPTWEGNDGSRVVAAARATADSPDAQAVPWLLLEARSNEGPGVFSAVTFVQRLNTSGGRAPATGCDQVSVGAEQRVDYTASYVFYYPSAAQ
ncbi:MAG TPA: DUF3455 domain-containing protein [Chloroflexota bacterium]|jgi:hypothetical protein